MASPLNPVIEECKRLRKTLIPISDKYHGLMEQISSRNTLYPFVLLLGNHSSGKSSFINHILKRKVQTTGVAPTDDNFTIIGPGESDIDRNGPALVGDPDLGFSGLKMFGPVLVNHTHLKVRANTAISDFMIVDSPGMIDSPVTHKSAPGAPVGMDRGYNFEGVCRWYAERADVILLFFDPDKPGTTGETLSILTTALVGLDHKMYIILNKADQFHKIHDFARAYGSLCWNLSKVIPRKDLPRIHTMCLPAKSTQSASPFDQASPPPLPGAEESDRSPSSSPSSELEGTNEELSDAGGLAAFAERSNLRSPDPIVAAAAATAAGAKATKTFFEQGVHDLEESRAEVEMETFNAPRRRVDNEISRLTETVSALLMHCKILDRVMETYHDKLWRARFLTACTIVGSVVVTIGANFLCDFLLRAPDSTIPALPSTDAPTATPVAKPASGGFLRGTGAAAVSAAKVVKVAAPSPSDVVPTPTFYTELFNFRSKRTIMSWVGLSGATAITGVITWAQYRITRLLNTFNEKSTFEGLYKQIYQKELAANDEFTIALGRTVLEEISTNINSEVVQRTQRVDKPDFFALNRILNEDIANLRRRASPNFPTLSAPAAKKMPSALSPPKVHSNIAVRAPSPSTEKLEHLALSTQAREAITRQHSRVHFSPSTVSSPAAAKDPLLKKSKKFFEKKEEDGTTIVLDNRPLPCAPSGTSGPAELEPQPQPVVLNTSASAGLESVSLVRAAEVQAVQEELSRVAQSQTKTGMDGAEPAAVTSSEQHIHDNSPADQLAVLTSEEPL